MDSLPNEVLRIILENLDFQQRSAIERVSMIFRYLNKTFPVIRSIEVKTAENKKKYKVEYTREQLLGPRYTTRIKRIF